MIIQTVGSIPEKDKMYPWHLDSANRTNLLLWRIDNNTFKVTQYDHPQGILTNVDYFLIDKKYMNPFIKLSGQITMNKEITIIDSVRNLAWENYFEIKIHTSISPNEINHIDSTGLKIWCYGDSIFVSNELKNELETIDNVNLEFNQGFSRFAG